MQQKICQEHGEEVEYFSKLNNELIGYCKTCVVTAKQPIIRAEVLIREVESRRVQLIKQIEEALDENQWSLSRLSQCLLQIKENQELKINKLIDGTKYLYGLLKKECNQNISSILNYQTLDEIQLFDYFRKVINQSALKENKNELKCVIESFQFEDSFKECESILDELQQVQWISYDQSPRRSKIKQIESQCQKHKELIIGVVSNDLDIKNDFHCMKCQNENPREFIILDEAQQWLNEFESLNQMQCFQFLKMVKSMNNLIMESSLSRIFNVKQKLNMLKSKLSKLEDKKQELIFAHLQTLNDYSLDLTYKKDFYIVNKIKKLSKSNQFDVQLQKFQEKMALNLSKETFSILLRTIQSAQKLILEQGIDHKEGLSDFQYNLINQFKLQKNEKCFALAINHDNTLVLASCNDLIKLYQFNKNKLLEFQKLKGHLSWVNCLKFINKKNIFVSAGSDRQVIVWKELQNTKWGQIQTLQGHKDGIVCLTTSVDGNIIISGCYDSEIKFWNLNNNEKWRNSQSIQVSKHLLYSFSLNESEDRIVVCGNEKQISILELHNNLWRIQQQIQTDSTGYRLCFITDQMFAFQPKCSEYLQIFNMNGNDKKIIKTQDIKVQTNKMYDEIEFSPQVFIKSKQILMSKNAKYINIIQKMEDGQFKTKQSLQFPEIDVYAVMSEDGNYLISWDLSSREIQVRKFIEK